MKKKNILLILSSFGPLILSAQVDSLSYPKSEVLDEVIIYKGVDPNSISTAVNNVRVIDAQDIKNIGATNLSDVLNQYININITPSSSTGKSKISMFGLDGSYFKILMDNIPIVSEEGFGNNIDLSQININDIEKIEIIEGSMGVTHGANAVSGILNIITKKSIQNKWEMTMMAQEETVGKEYRAFSEGRHIQSLAVRHRINEHLFASLSGNRNDLQGYKGELQGKDHSSNDGKRGYRWLPKDQIQTNALISYQKNRFRAFYKFEYLNEKIDFYDAAVNSGFNDEFGAYKYGNDERYYVNRIYNHLNINGSLASGARYDFSISNQSQRRDVEKFRYNISDDVERNNDKKKDQAMDVWYSVGTFSNFFKSEVFKPIIGYEWANNHGFSVVDDLGNVKKEIDKNINNLDFYVSSGVQVSPKLLFNPGIRYSFQSLFENQSAYSLGMSYLIKNGLESRASIGKSYRTPSFEELYNKLIFDGHYFVGNENLIPESSFSFETSLKKTTTFSDSNILMSNQIQFGLLNIKDRITSAVVGFDGATPMYEYINISKYNNLNFALSNRFQIQNLNVNLGGSFSWLSQKINNLEFSTSDEYLFTYNLQANASYLWEKPKLTLSVFYKYISKAPQWVMGSENYIISMMDSYNWLDVTLRKSFLSDKFEATIGARNLFNVVSVNQSRINEGNGHSVDSQVMLAYGTSYFVKLVYNLKLK